MNNTPPPLRSIVAVLALLALALIGGLGLYALTPVAHRPNVWALLSTQWPAIIAAGGALFAWLTGRATRDTLAQHSTQLATISENTNGKLTARIETVVRSVLGELVPQLVIPQPPGWTPMVADPVPAPAPPDPLELVPVQRSSMAG